MKISKSFKIYIHIILLYLISHNLYGAEDFSKNIVIHEKPTQIKELKFKDSDLNEVDLTNKKGNIMILNFWATWCAPCKREMPSLEKLTNQFPQVKVYAINMEQPNNLFVSATVSANFTEIFDGPTAKGQLLTLLAKDKTVEIVAKTDNWARVEVPTGLYDGFYVKMEADTE